MTDWLGIKGKVVLVTGGSSGIGRSIVESLLAQEVYVANFDISASETQHEHLLFVKVDVTRAEVEAGVAQVVEKFGTVDGLVNNAGINIPRLLVDKNHPHGPYELSDEVFDKIVAINQKGLYLMSQAVGRILVQNKQVSLLICLQKLD